MLVSVLIVSNLWEENTNLTSQIEQTKAFEISFDLFERKLSEVEQRYDTKLEVFTLELENSFIQKIATLQNNFKTNIDNLEKTISKLQNNIEDKTVPIMTPLQTQDQELLQSQIDTMKAEQLARMG